MAKAVTLQIGGAMASLDNVHRRVLIGRDGAICNLVAGDGSVSRRHAEVYLQGDQVFILDLGSSNGTWVNGQRLGPQPVALQPGSQVYVGHVPLSATWSGDDGAGATVMGEMPPELLQQMQAQYEQARAQGFAAAAGTARGPTSASTAAESPAQAPSAAAAAQAESGELGLGGMEAPVPAEYAYRRQGSNDNGVLLIALKHDTFSNDQVLDGYLEYTAMDNETVASITIELVEVHRKGPKKGHVWDRMLVRQGPWKSRKGDVLPMPFQLRVPPGTSASGPSVYWELRGYVDIAWAFDVKATCPINMRNSDVERIRDALGALDYRIVEMEPEPLGQHYLGKFQPPAQYRKQLGIANVDLELEYLGSNLKMKMKVEKTSLFKFDKQVEFVFELARLRAAPLAQLSQHFQTYIDQLMGR